MTEQNTTNSHEQGQHNQYENTQDQGLTSNIDGQASANDQLEDQAINQGQENVIDKVRNDDAVQQGLTTELPKGIIYSESLTKKSRPMGYLDALAQEKRLQWSVADFAEKASAEKGNLYKLNLEREKDSLSSLQESLEHARSWASVLQEARARGVEIPEKYSSPDRIMYYERRLEDDRNKRDNLVLAIMEFHGADEARDVEVLYKIMRNFDNISHHFAGSPFVDWLYQFSDTPEGALANQAFNRFDDRRKGSTSVYGEDGRLDIIRSAKKAQEAARWDDLNYARVKLYFAPIEILRAQVEVQEHFLPIRDQLLRRDEDELRDFVEKVGYPKAGSDDKSAAPINSHEQQS